ncbi:hypothetical protein AA105894_2320 [Asaia spathodeae NBRC 105894]|nr:hypothetical protein AA105894_2320 [Asaia spathodeae NBRC 105894]
MTNGVTEEGTAMDAICSAASRAAAGPLFIFQLVPIQSDFKGIVFSLCDAVTVSVTS